MNPPASARSGEPDVANGDEPGVAGLPRHRSGAGHDSPVPAVDPQDQAVAGEPDDGEGRTYGPL